MAIVLQGEARVSVERERSVFGEPRALDMAVDVMFDRGFALRVEERLKEYRFKITFRPPQLQNVASEGKRRS